MYSEDPKEELEIRAIHSWMWCQSLCDRQKMSAETFAGYVQDYKGGGYTGKDLGDILHRLQNGEEDALKEKYKDKGWFKGSGQV